MINLHGPPLKVGASIVLDARVIMLLWWPMPVGVVAEHCLVSADWTEADMVAEEAVPLPTVPGVADEEEEGGDCAVMDAGELRSRAKQQVTKETKWDEHLNR